MNISAASQLSLANLRPPFARSGLVLFAYAGDSGALSGITVQLETGEPAVAPGAGNVVKIYTQLARWQTNSAALQYTPVTHIVIDHGNQVSTLIAGINNVSVQMGQTVSRGDRLGALLTNQVFCSVTVGKKMLNPTAVNEYWKIQNDSVVIGQGGKIRFAPDRIARDLSAGVTVALVNGVRYFKQLLAPTPVLVNIAFNGDGSKTGLGATGYAADDHWNVYTPLDFLASSATCCSYGVGVLYTFSDDPVLALNDYTDTLCPVLLERVAPLYSAAGTATSWDDMLKAWIGGYSGPIPYENTFRLRNLAAGSYDLYLYAEQGTYPASSTFYVSVGGGSPSALSTAPTGVTAFVETDNYVKFTLTVPTDSQITIKCVGYFSGLQLQRV